MKKQHLKHMVIAWGLFTSLMIPMLLDGLHYVIFEHHDSEHSQNFAYQNQKSSHKLCSYPFVTEDLNNQTILLAPFERTIEFFFFQKEHLAENILFFPNPLRGPPCIS